MGWTYSTGSSWTNQGISPAGTTEINRGGQEMTQTEKERLKDLLYQAKFITDKVNEDPFIGIYLTDLIDLLDDYKNGKIWHEKKH